MTPEELQAAAVAGLTRRRVLNGGASVAPGPGTLAAFQNFKSSMPASSMTSGVQPGVATKGGSLANLTAAANSANANFRNISQAYANPGLGSPGGVAPPPASLANSPEVNQAYRNLMNYTAQSDADKGQLRRSYATNIDTSHKNRDKSILNSHTSLNDNGLLNSGIALKRDTELNTNYDTVDNQMTDNLNKSIDDIGRHIQGLTQDYQDRQVEASAAETQRRADAAAAALASQTANTQQQAQIDKLMAALNGQVTNAPAAAPVDDSYGARAQAWIDATARNNAAAAAAATARTVQAKKPVASGTTGHLAQKRSGIQ